MKIFRILIFVFLFNLVLTMLYGLNVFSWGKGAGTGDVLAFSWEKIAKAMIGTSIVTGVFGLLTQMTAMQVMVFFTGVGAFAMTVTTMNWLELPTPITAVVSGMIGLLCLFAIIQILSGSAPD